MKKNEIVIYQSQDGAITMDDERLKQMGGGDSSLKVRIVKDKTKRVGANNSRPLFLFFIPSTTYPTSGRKCVAKARRSEASIPNGFRPDKSAARQERHASRQHRKRPWHDWPRCGSPSRRGYRG